MFFGKRPAARDGFRSECNTCRYLSEKSIKAAYRAKNKSKIKEYRSKYYSSNKIVENVKSKEYKSSKQLEIREYNREYSKKRLIEDPLFRLRSNIRKRINKELRKSRWNKNNSLSHYLGCSLEELKKYLESKFQPGMTWENHGLYGWHVDHIVPLSKAKSEKELYALSHFSNLQPLWAAQNLLKGDKV